MGFCWKGLGIEPLSFFWVLISSIPGPWSREFPPNMIYSRIATALHTQLAPVSASRQEGFAAEVKLWSERMSVI